MAAIQPAVEFGRRVEMRSGQPVNRCYQCRKCSGGCPIAFAMDILPHQLIRLVQMGLSEKALHSKTIWVCASCRTCVSRCPNGIDVAAVADALKQVAVESGIAVQDNQVYAFHQSFLKSVKNNGRLHELGMIASYKLRTKTYTQDLAMGLGMFRRGKLKLVAEKISRRDEIRQIFARAGEVKV